MTRSWSIEQEINLYNLVCDFKPAGTQRDENISQILTRINENLGATEKFTAEQIWAKLGENYDLEKVEEIEMDSEEETEAMTSASQKKEGSIKAKSKESSPKDSSVEPQPKNSLLESITLPENNTAVYPDADVYSSELSDIDGDDTEVEKLQEKDILPDAKPTRRGRPKRPKSSPAPKEASKIAPRKRTRSIAKDTDEESAPKRRQSNATKRKKKPVDTPKNDTEVTQTEILNDPTHKLEANEEVKDENEQHSMDEGVENQKEEVMDQKDKNTDESELKEDLKTKKPKRQPVRRSTRKK